MSGEHTGAPEQIGPYRIVATLGEGGMGVVYHARRADLDHDVAVKVLRPALRHDANLVARFRREATAAASVAGHPGLVAVHDTGVDGDLAWCAMDYVDGRSMDALIAEGELAPTQAAALMEQVARALEHIHDLGILHRDLKPANILVTPEGRARVTDFGLAAVRPAGPDVTRLTQSEFLIGTPSYMPPEQITGESLEPTADVYAAGATLYEALCGRPPYEGPSIVATLERVLHGDLVPPSTVVPSVPAALERIALRCLARDPADRYPTALALAEDLARYQRGEPVLAGGASSFARAAIRQKGPLLMAGLLAAVVAAVAGLWPWLSGRTDAVSAAEGETRATTEVAELDAAYAAMELRTLESLRGLEDCFHGLPVSDSDRTEALNTIARVSAEVQRAHPRSTLPRAWHGLALCYAGDTARGRPLLDAACDRATDPFALILRARLQLAHWMREFRIPAGWIIDERMHFLPEPESPDMIRARTGAADDLDLAAGMPLFARLQRGREYVAFATAVRAYLNGDDTQAMAQFESVAHNTPMVQEARLMLGHLYYRAQRFEDAATTFTHAAERGWLRPLSHAGTAWLSHAMTLANDSQAQLAAYHRSREAHIRLLKLHPGDAPGTVGLAEATLGVAQLMLLAGQDPEPLLDAVINDCTNVPARGGHAVRARVTRSTAHMLKGTLARTAGRDQRAHLRASVADHEWIVERVADQPKLWRRLGTELGLLAHQEHRAGNDQPDLFARALRAYDEAYRLAPRDPPTHHGRALALIYRAEAKSRGSGPPEPDWDAALDSIAEAETLAPGRWENAHLRMRVWRDRGNWLRRRRQDTPEYWARAVAAADAAARLTPQNAALIGRRGGMRMRWADCVRRLGGNPSPQFTAAVEDLNLALRLDPDNADHLGDRASCNLQLAFYTRVAGGDDRPVLESALADADAALAVRDTDHIPHAVKVDVLERLGRLTEALAAAAVALRHHPNDGDLRAAHARLREQLGK